MKTLPMAHDVFVSYSQQDKPTADAVVARLEQDGIRCWMAPRDIVPGTSWGDAIVTAIAGSKVMVLILSANSNRSRQVVREVERAVAGDVIILPFRIESVDPTGAMAYFLGTEHWLDALTPPLERHIARLAQTTATLLAGERVDRGTLDRAPASAGRRRTRLPRWALGAGIGLAAVVVLAVALSVRSDSPTTTTAALPTTTATLPVVTAALEEVGRFAPADLDPTGTRVPDLVYGFDIDGPMLVIANGVDGVTRLAIGDPAEPRPLDTFGVTDARAVAFTGGYVYALSNEPASQDVIVFPIDGSGGVSLPMGTSQVGSLYTLEVADGYLYVAGHDYVGIADVTDPGAPALVFEWETPASTGNPADVFVSDGIGYFSAGWDGLYMFDLADPTAPDLLGHWPSPDWVIDVVVIDDIAYLTLGSAVATVDVGDPARPVVLGSVESPGFASPLAVAYGHAFVGVVGEQGALGAIAVFDVTAPEAPTLVGTFGAFQTVTGVQVVGDHLFVTDESQGLIVFAITGIG